MGLGSISSLCLRKEISEMMVWRKQIRTKSPLRTCNCRSPKVQTSKPCDKNKCRVPN